MYPHKVHIVIINIVDCELAVYQYMYKIYLYKWSIACSYVDNVV